MKCDELTPIELECNMGKDVNGVEHRETWKAYDIDEVDALLAKKDAEIEELKQKLEDAKAMHYAESVDAGMENRRLKRALWLARAERASDKARIFYFAYTCGVKLNIDGFSNKEKGHTRMCTARWWRITWLKVERKCRAKAEEYK